MEKAKYISIEYEPSDNIEMQGKYEKVQKYEKQGYYAKENRNGYWVLVKPAKVFVTLANSKCTKTFNMKESILSYYCKQRISQRLLGEFEDDAENGKIIFEMNEDGTEYNMK